MLVRLGFAIATAIDPEILLLDEGLGAGDARFATRAAKRVEAMIERSSIMVLASHSDELIRQMCNRAILLDHGRVIADGPTEEVLEIYARVNQDEPPKPLPAPERSAGRRQVSPRLPSKHDLGPARIGTTGELPPSIMQANATSRGERWTIVKHVKIFADGADIDGILALYKNPLIKGFTTNPTLMRKAGIDDYEAFARQLVAAIPDRPISFEVFADDFDEMIAQGRVIASWGANVNVKIPVTTTKGAFTGPVIRTLANAGVIVNVTAIMTAEQVERGRRVPGAERPGDRLGLRRARRRYRPRSGSAHARLRCARSPIARKRSCSGPVRASCSTSFRPMRSAATSSRSATTCSPSSRWSARISTNIRSRP